MYLLAEESPAFIHIGFIATLATAIFEFPSHSLFLFFTPCKGSAKFRLSEGNEKKFSFLSVRKLIKLSEMQNKSLFIFISEMQPIFSKGERYDCNATLIPLGVRISEDNTKQNRVFVFIVEREYLDQGSKVVPRFDLQVEENVTKSCESENFYDYPQSYHQNFGLS